MLWDNEATNLERDAAARKDPVTAVRGHLLNNLQQLIEPRAWPDVEAQTVTMSNVQLQAYMKLLALGHQYESAAILVERITSVRGQAYLSTAVEAYARMAR